MRDQSFFLSGRGMRTRKHIGSEYTTETVGKRLELLEHYTTVKK